jgi:peptide deformylase
MRDTMRDATGVGLAAPQVGEPLQIVVIEDPEALLQTLPPENLALRERAAVPFHVLVNPTLVVDGNETVEFFEGCLSVGGMMMVVSRARAVRVEALDEHGEPVVKVARGWYARILQHEIDHLHGVLCSDRMIPRTLMTVDNHTRLWKSQSIAEVKTALGAETP